MWGSGSLHLTLVRVEWLPELVPEEQGLRRASLVCLLEAILVTHTDMVPVFRLFCIVWHLLLDMCELCY